MKKILILCPYPESMAAGQRLKYEQYFESWEASGYELQKSSFFSISTWDVLWSKGHLLRKITGTIQGYFRRINDLYKLQGCDVVYIFMWATPLGLPFYEWLILKSGKKIIYDFDDAVFSSSDHLSLIKGGYKSQFLIKHSHQVILSSPFLLDHCMENNKHSKVIYIPCSLDLNRFKLKTSEWPKHYLDSIRDVFYEVDKYLDVKIILITNFNYSLEGLDCEVIRWEEPSEISDLHKIDIGLYPLIQTNWALGKGGLKALQYMAAGIPAIATNFGTVKDFITHEKNGFLVDSTKQWVNAIKMVAENTKLRNNIIINARNTVETNYSVLSNEKKYLNVFEELTKGLN
jgi:glycosyltransferase involved in cell wall biosynthesis